MLKSQFPPFVLETANFAFTLASKQIPNFRLTSYSLKIEKKSLHKKDEQKLISVQLLELLFATTNKLNFYFQ